MMSLLKTMNSALFSSERDILIFSKRASKIIFATIEKLSSGDGEIAQWFIALVVLAEKLN